MSGYTDEMQKEYPPTIISFPDAMRLLQMARDALRNNKTYNEKACFDACYEIAKAFERPAVMSGNTFSDSGYGVIFGDEKPAKAFERRGDDVK